jgi:hypothetical protein
MRHPDHVRAWFADQGRRVVTLCDDGALRIWDAAGSLLVPPIRPAEPLEDWTIDRRGQLLAAATESGSVGIWDVLTGEPVMPLRELAGGVGAMAFTPDSRALVVHSYRGDAAITIPLTPAAAPVDVLAQQARCVAAMTEIPEARNGAPPQPGAATARYAASASAALGSAIAETGVEGGRIA